MNAGSLWAGTEYAWMRYRPRGTFPMHAEKIKVIKVSKVRQFGNQNASTVVKAEIIRSGEPKEIEVRARDIIDFWDEYEAERAHRREESERRELERKRVIQERAEAAEAARIKEREKNTAIAEALEKMGLDPAGITSMSTWAVTLDRGAVEHWLGIADLPS